jgi:hypothetical protein
MRADGLRVARAAAPRDHPTDLTETAEENPLASLDSLTNRESRFRTRHNSTRTGPQRPMISPVICPPHPVFAGLLTTPANSISPFAPARMK